MKRVYDKVFYFSINASLFCNIQTVKTSGQRQLASDTNDGATTRQSTPTAKRLFESAVS
jgi:hypothetical protein